MSPDRSFVWTTPGGPPGGLIGGNRWRRSLLRTGAGLRSVAGQVMVLQTAMLLVLVAAIGAVCAVYSHRTIQDDYATRVLTIAQTVAGEPQVRSALADDNDHTASRIIDPLALSIQRQTGVLFVVVADRHGIRVAHPNPDLIGQPLSTAPGEALQGTAYVATQTGTLGTSLRAKAPVYAPTGRQVVGLVSVGVQLANLDNQENHALLAIALLGVLVLAIAIAAVRWLSGHVRRQTHGLRSDEITRLLENREAMLHGLHEGMLAVDPDGRIHLVNDAARQLLDLPPDVVGRPAEEVLPEGRLRAMMRAGATPAAPDEASVLVVHRGRLLVASRSSASVGDRQVGHTVTLRDQTELLRVTRKFDTLTSTAKSLRVQAHEFRNRLHVIAGLLELGRADEAMRYITRLHQAQEREAGRLRTALGEGTLTALLLAKQAVAAEAGCRLEVRVDGTGWHSALEGGDPDFAEDVTTIIGNLVENALEELGRRPDGRVLVHMYDGPDGRLCADVSDNGGGIPAELADTVFREGFSVRPADRGSRGVGLALVRDTARRRDGDATVRPPDEPGPDGLTGATIRVRLPHPALAGSTR